MVEISQTNTLFVIEENKTLAQINHDFNHNLETNSTRTSNNRLTSITQC